jgi:ribonuclease HI
MARHIEIYVDGIAEPNPGHACWAWLAKVDGQVVGQDSGYIGRTTNNVAEYYAAGHALKWINDQAETFIVNFYSDSQLVLNQISGAWACNKEELRRLRDRCRALLEGLSINLAWIPGAENPADELTREAYRTHVGKEPPQRHADARAAIYREAIDR